MSRLLWAELGLNLDIVSEVPCVILSCSWVFENIAGDSLKEKSVSILKEGPCVDVWLECYMSEMGVYQGRKPMINWSHGVSSAIELDKQVLENQVCLLLWRWLFQFSQSLGLQPYRKRGLGICKNEITRIKQQSTITSPPRIWVDPVTNNQMCVFFFLAGNLGL